MLSFCGDDDVDAINNGETNDNDGDDDFIVVPFDFVVRRNFVWAPSRLRFLWFTWSA